MRIVLHVRAKGKLRAKAVIADITWRNHCQIINAIAKKGMIESLTKRSEIAFSIGRHWFFFRSTFVHLTRLFVC